MVAKVVVELVQNQVVMEQIIQVVAVEVDPVIQVQ